MAKKRPEGINFADPGADQQLRDAIANLVKSDTAKWFFTIRRRKGNDYRWSYWRRNIPVDELDDIRDFCHKSPEGGDEWNYKIQVHDGKGNKAQLPTGEVIEDSLIPAMREPTPEASSTDDPIMKTRLDALQQKEKEMMLRRQEYAIRKQEESLVKMETGGEDDDDDDDSGGYSPFSGPQYPYHPQLNPYGNPYGMQGTTPWGQQQQQQEKGMSDREFFVALAQAMRPSEQKPMDMEFLKILLPIMMANKGGGFDPKDMLGFVSPMMQEMSSTYGDVTKLAMEKASDSDTLWKKKMLELIDFSGKDDDQIAHYKKIVDLVTGGIAGATKAIFGRPSIVPGKKVDVPVLPQAPKEVQQAEPEESSSPPPQQDSPPAQNPGRDKIRELISGRVKMILLAQEEEMQVGSEPGLVAEKLEEAWLLLPETLRVKLEPLPLDRVYEILREYEAEIVDRILAEVKKDESGAHKKWCIAFWAELRRPVEEEEDDDDDDEPEEPPEPQPEPDPVEKVGNES